MTSTNLLRSLLALSFAVSLFATAIPAVAQNSAFYAGASAGITDADVCGGLGLSSCDNNDTGLKLFGGMSFTRNFAAEIGWIDLGTLSATGPGGTAEISIDGFQVAALGIAPLGADFSLFGKLGLYFWDASASGPGGSGSVNGNDLMFGGGVMWKFAPRFDLRGEWERFDVDGEDVNFWSVGVQYRF